MVCEFKNIRAIVAVGIITLAACSGDKICEPPTPQIESSSSAISSSSDNGGTELSSCSKADDSSSSTKSSSSVSVEKPSSSSAELSPKPFWNDEFDGDAIDNSKWTYDIGTGASGWGNNEKEYYTNRKENAYVKDGILHIRAQKEDYEGSKYTSARMLTKGKFAFKYGTVEARIALPTGQGIWQSISSKPSTARTLSMAQTIGQTVPNTLPTATTPATTASKNTNWTSPSSTHINSRGTKSTSACSSMISCITKF